MNDINAPMTAVDQQADESFAQDLKRGWTEKPRFDRHPADVPHSHCRNDQCPQPRHCIANGCQNPGPQT